MSTLKDDFVQRVCDFIDLYLQAQPQDAKGYPIEYPIELPRIMCYRIRESFRHDRGDIYHTIAEKYEKAGWHCYLTDSGVGLNRS